MDEIRALMWFGDSDGHCLGCNEQWFTWSGRSIDSEVGDGWLDSVHPDDAMRCQQVILDHTRTHSPLALDLQLRREDGEFRPMLAAGVPRVDSAGAFCGLTIAMIDVSEFLAGRRTKADVMALLNAALAEAHTSTHTGTASGAAVQRIANFLGAESTSRNPGRTTPHVRTMHDLDTAPADARHGTTDGMPTVLVACRVTTRTPLNEWGIAELHRILAERLLRTMRADDLVIEVGSLTFVVALRAVNDAAGLSIARDVLADTLSRPVLLGGQRVGSSIVLAWTTQAANEELRAAAERVMERLDEAACAAAIAAA